MEAAKPLPQAKSLPPTFDKLIKELPGLINQELPVAKQSNAKEPAHDSSRLEIHLSGRSRS